MTKSYVPYQVPRDVDERLRLLQERIAARRGVSVTKVSRSGETLRVLLAMADAAEPFATLPATDAAK